MLVNPIVRFCAEEVERQGRGPEQVADMYDAWMYAITADWTDPLFVIRRCGQLVEPTKNDGGWRSCGVRVGTHVAPRPADVPDLMRLWAAQMSNVSPADAYRDFQRVHPFRDGNGRVGKIIFNHLSGTMQHPIMPPNFFGCANP